MDTQRYTRKVRTCEKDMAKAKENLEKWGQPPVASIPSSALTNGNSQPASILNASEENSKPLSETSMEQASSVREQSIDVKGTVQSKQEKGELSCYCDKILLFILSIDSISAHTPLELLEKIDKARAIVENCEKRMQGYRIELAERTNLEARENSCALKLKTWCQMVKSEVLSPMTDEEAALSRPRSNNHTSIPIEKARALADSLGIVSFPDIGVVLNSFKVFAWCLHLLEVLMRKPTIEEIRSLLAMCDNIIKIPESKCIRMLRSISSRAQLWQSKAKKVLAPDNKAQKPYEISLLREVLLAAKQIPVTMPEEVRLWNTIEDKGCRHCVCGGKTDSVIFVAQNQYTHSAFVCYVGPSDGSFMLGCDSCDKWFHGSCMKLDQAASDTLTNWICPPCSGKGSDHPDQVNGAKSPTEDKSNPPIEFNHPIISNISPHAPNPVTLWPPFGLRSSPSAVEALGKIGESDNEDFVRRESKAAQPASKSSASGVKKEDVGSKSVKCGVVLASGESAIVALKAEKPNSVPSKHVTKSVEPKATIKIPAQLVTKGVVGQVQPIPPAASLKVATALSISNAPKTGVKSVLSTLKPSTVKSAKPTLPASSAPKTAIRTGIPTTSLVKPPPTIPSNKPTVPKQLAKNSSNVVGVKPPASATGKNGSFSSTVVSSKSVVKNIVAKPFVVPRDSARKTEPTAAEPNVQSTTRLLQTAAPVASYQLKTSSVSSLPQCISRSTVPSGSHIKYPKPDSRVGNALNGTSLTVQRIMTTGVKPISQSKSQSTTDSVEKVPPCPSGASNSASCISNGSKNPPSNNNAEVGSASH